MNYPGMQNYQYVTKKYLFELLKEKYASNEQIIERVTHYLSTEQDVKDFVQMFVDCFERGYLKAIEDYRGKLRELGYEINIVAEKKTT